MKNNKNKMINIRIDEVFYKKYKKFCETNGYSISKRIRVLIEKDIEL